MGVELKHQEVLAEVDESLIEIGVHNDESARDTQNITGQRKRQIMHWYTTPDWWIAIGTFSAVVIAWRQLYLLRKSNEIQTVLELESQLNERKVAFSKATIDRKRIDTQTAINNATGILSEMFDNAKENYFNVLDRLCFCILKGYLKERDWKAE